MELHHQSFEVQRGSRNILIRHGWRLHDMRVSSGRVLVFPGFWPRIAIVIQFHHGNQHLVEGAWTCGDIAHSGTKPHRVHTTETVFEECL